MMANSTLQLGSRPLSLSELRRVYAGPVRVEIDSGALRALRDSHAATTRLASRDQPAYGINTGFGLLAQTRIPTSQRALLQRNIILSHSTGVGPLLDDSVVRLILVLKLASLARGFSGVSEKTARFLEQLINGSNEVAAARRLCSSAISSSPSNPSIPPPANRCPHSPER